MDRLQPSVGDNTDAAPDSVLTDRIIGAAIEVHRALGRGVLESAYEACLERELFLRDVRVRRQVPVPLLYKGLRLECGYRLDMLVEERVVVEVKSASRFDSAHVAQVLTYLRLSNLRLGLLLNFNVPMLKAGGIRRVVWGRSSQRE